jgi:hypothetical protein
MVDFKMGQVLGLMSKTAPFVIFRLIVYTAVALAYVFSVGVGAGTGYLIGHIGDNPGGAGAFGGFLGFGIVSVALYWFREYLLYLVKAGHIAVLVELMDGKTLPQGKGQIDYAREKVQERFKEASLLFGIDQLIKGILKAVNRTFFTIAAFLPIPGLEALVSFLNKILTMSLTYLDEVIIAYNMRLRSENPWQTSRDALVLYAQNYKVILKNAVFLVLIMYLLTFVLFLIVVGPFLALAGLLPGAATGWGVVLAIVFAWALKAALLEPVAMCALMGVFFKVTEGQTPNQEWEDKLAGVSDKFRELTEKATSYASSKMDKPEAGPEAEAAPPA